MTATRGMAELAQGPVCFGDWALSSFDKWAPRRLRRDRTIRALIRYVDRLDLCETDLVRFATLFDGPSGLLEARYRFNDRPQVLTFLELLGEWIEESSASGAPTALRHYLSRLSDGMETGLEHRARKPRRCSTRWRRDRERLTCLLSANGPPGPRLVGPRPGRREISLRD